MTGTRPSPKSQRRSRGRRPFLLRVEELEGRLLLDGMALLQNHPVYSVAEVSFTGPAQGPTDVPARDVDFWVEFRHESGSPTYRVHGFWDGDGQGGAAGSVFKARFTPTLPGRWDLLDVFSNRPELNDQHQNDFLTAVPSAHHGFWVVDPASAGQRWYMRSDGLHPYIFGNTEYSFIAGVDDNHQVRPNIPQHIVDDILGNAQYFKKLRFAVTGDQYFHPTEKPFFNAAGSGTDDGDHSHRPNPAWFRSRVDLAVQTAFGQDLITDLILAGPDVVDARATLRADQNGGDPTPYLKYIAARYGSYPNVWLTLANEYNIKTPTYTTQQIATFGQVLKGFLPYPTPLSVHANTGDWSANLNTAPPWHDHQVLQNKLRDLSDSAVEIGDSYANGGSNRPTINDELSYQGAGDNHSEEDTIESHLGAFLGGGHATTGYKTGNKIGQYFNGPFNAAEHTAADNLLWLRQQIDADITFWRMAPVALASSIFAGADAGFRALQWAGNEYVLATDAADSSVIANLPTGQWIVTRYDVLSKTETVLSTSASGAFAFSAPASRAVLFHFRRDTGTPAPQTVSFSPEADTYIDERFPTTNFATSVELGVGGGTSDRDVYLRFNITGLPAGAIIQAAQLDLTVTAAGRSTESGGTIRRYSPADPSWPETQPTYQSPLPGNDGSGDLSTLGAVNNNELVSFTNLAGAIGGNGLATFIIHSDLQDGAQYHSQNSATTSARPVLRVTYTVPILQVESVTTSASGFTVQFTRPIDTNVLNLYGTGTPDVRLTGAATGAVRGSLVVNAVADAATFLATGGVLAPDVYTVTLRSAADGFRDTAGGLLGGNGDGMPGGDHSTTLTVLASSAVVVSIPDLARGPGQMVAVPATSTGLPLRLGSSAGVTAVSLKLRHDPALLRITVAAVAPGLPAGAQVTLDTTSMPGVAIINFSSPALPAGVTDFVRLTADVPMGTSSQYGAKQVLDLFDVQVNGVPGVDDDGVHVVAYLGDVTGNGSYSSADAARVLRVGLGLDGGFAAFRLSDPVLIADVNSNGRIDSTDATRLLQEAVGIDQAQVPPLPPNAPTIVAPGPDPLLFIPRILRGQPGETVSVAVLLDRSEGLEAVDLAISYDVTRLELLAAERGNRTGDFDLLMVNPDPAAGTLRVGLSRSAGPIGDRGSGSVLLLTFRIREDAPAGRAIINLRQGLGTTRTQLNEGGLDLNPDPSDRAGDVLDGTVTVRAQRGRDMARDLVFTAGHENSSRPVLVKELLRALLEGSTASRKRRLE